MKTAALCITAILLIGMEARADQSSKLLKIDELFKITKVEQMQQQVVEQMKSTMASQMAETARTPESKALSEKLQRQFGALVTDRMSWEKMRPGYVRIYDEAFTEEELTGIIEFYRSPAGEALIGKMPDLVAKSMELGRQAMADLMPEIKRMVDDMKQPK